jgi:hypothetical protein
LTEAQPDDEFEWLYLMQHYGSPTRLLDWTESSLVGLYFAVCNYRNDSNSAVWVLSPRRYNYTILKASNTVPISSSVLLKDYLIKQDDGNNLFRKVEAKLPLAFRPAKNSSRILAQRGFFTIHGNEDICINELIKSHYESSDQVLRQILIHKDFKVAILKELYNCGISPSVIFPVLTGISEELVMKYTTFYNKK